MRTNHEIKTRHALLDEKGRLIEPGYTKGLMMDYDKTKHKGGKFRLKEWDYYLIACDDFAVCLTVAFSSIIKLAISTARSSIYPFKKIPCNTFFTLYAGVV